MTLLNDRLKKAGVNTAEARLAILAVDALRECKGSLEPAAQYLWRSLVYESWVVNAVWLMPYLRDRKRDMQGTQPEIEKTPEPIKSTRSSLRNYPSPERKAAVDKLIKKAVDIIKFNYNTSDGRDWARVGAHELDGMDRDGELARAVKSKLGALTNKQRYLDIGELMTAETFNEIRTHIRKANAY